MAQFHFVEDYQNLVKKLMAEMPIDEAMSHAVGGHWEVMGERCADLLIENGFKSGMNILDFGCGSGRVALPLSKKITPNGFVGIDIVEELLQYAAGLCPDYEFVLNHSLKIEVADDMLDGAYAFSVFTHLLQTEILIYKNEIFKKLRSNGIFIYSFLELNNHWDMFLQSAGAHLAAGRPYPHLNMFLDRNQIEIMSQKVGFTVERFIEPSDPSGIGQSVVVLRKP